MQPNNQNEASDRHGDRQVIFALVLVVVLAFTIMASSAVGTVLQRDCVGGAAESCLQKHPWIGHLFEYYNRAVPTRL